MKSLGHLSHNAVARGKRSILSLSEVVASMEGTEVYAEAEAWYNDEKKRLEVELKVYARHIGKQAHLKHERKNSLPPCMTVDSHVSLRNATREARDIFDSWIRRIRCAITASSDATPAREIR